MEDGEGSRQAIARRDPAPSPIFHPPSSFFLRRYAASVSPLPPGRLVPTGTDVGPATARGLYQQAQIQTFEPGAVSGGKATRTVVRVQLPSNFQAVSSAGAAAPTKL
jgi:hypothetical protein